MAICVFSHDQPTAKPSLHLADRVLEFVTSIAQASDNIRRAALDAGIIVLLLAGVSDIVHGRLAGPIKSWINQGQIVFSDASRPAIFHSNKTPLSDVNAEASKLLRLVQEETSRAECLRHVDEVATSWDVQRRAANTLLGNINGVPLREPFVESRNILWSVLI